jgi:hypothetical protein
MNGAEGSDLAIVAMSRFVSLASFKGPQHSQDSGSGDLTDWFVSKLRVGKAKEPLDLGDGCL